MISRRGVVLTGTLFTGGCAAGLHSVFRQHDKSDFVRVDGQHFVLRGEPYRYAGTNMWYGAYLGALGPTGNRDRLRRELDALAALGITNLRVLGSSELSPLKNSMRPAFRGPKPPYNDDLLVGLDYLLAEMGKRDLKAVIYLNNYWEWTGGMVTYLYWTNGGHYIDMNDPAHPWPAFADLSAQFYGNTAANALYRNYVDAVVGRRNTVTGIAYRDDPAIMSWQLANEPRPGGSLAHAQFDAFYAWIADTARFIKSWDANHLVSTGNEGLKGCLESEDCVVRTNAISGVDYMTFHIWPLNWGWIDPKNMAGTYPSCEANTKDYIATHLGIAQQVNKPAVAEEFGLPRDGGEYAISVPTTYRDRYYKLIFDAVRDSASKGGPFAGTNFWAWGGEGRAEHPDFMMQPGDTSLVGDPPQEPQGRNSVFNCDASTLDIIRSHATDLTRLRTAA
ncbi:MAG: mannanase [Alphaproteobacteria bacterium]|nr:mannanase [Alphaproteobacteria bacterium]